MKKIFMVGIMVFLAAGCGRQLSNTTPPQSNQQPAGTINSITLEPSGRDGAALAYSNGAVIKVVGENLDSVEIKYLPTGARSPEQTLGQAVSLSSQINTWTLPLPKGINASSLWAEGKDRNGTVIKSADLGNITYDLPLNNTDTKNGYRIEYPRDFSFTTTNGKPSSYIPVCDDSMVGCVYYSGQGFKGTNLEAAAVSINILRTYKTEAQCYNFKVSTNEAQKDAGTATINGVQFKSATGGSAGAGHFDEVTAYRNFHNGLCYELSQHIASSNSANYEPGAIQEFNRNEVVQKLQGIVQSFQFISAQSSATTSSAGKLRVCPDEWIEDRMPSPDRKPGDPYNAYFVIKGVRKEIVDYDLDWIKNNCPVNQPTIAY